MIDQPAVKFWPWTSTVTSGHDATCPAPKQGNKCGSCRCMLEPLSPDRELWQTLMKYKTVHKSGLQIEKLQATSLKHQYLEDASCKLQARKLKVQASSRKLQAP